MRRHPYRRCRLAAGDENCKKQEGAATHPLEGVFRRRALSRGRLTKDRGFSLRLLQDRRGRRHLSPASGSGGQFAGQYGLGLRFRCRTADSVEGEPVLMAGCLGAGVRAAGKAAGTPATQAKPLIRQRNLLIYGRIVTTSRWFRGKTPRWPTVTQSTMTFTTSNRARRAAPPSSRAASIPSSAGCRSRPTAARATASRAKPRISSAWLPRSRSAASADPAAP